MERGTDQDRSAPRGHTRVRAAGAYYSPAPEQMVVTALDTLVDVSGAGVRADG